MRKANEILLPKFKKWGDTISNLSKWCIWEFCLLLNSLSIQFKFTKSYLTSKIDYSALYIM